MKNMMEKAQKYSKGKNIENDSLYLINDSIMYFNGEILFNPFLPKNDLNVSLRWVMENLGEVRKLIKYWLYQLGSKSIESDIGECESLVYIYFYKNDFKLNNVEISFRDGFYVSSFVKSSIKYIVHSYLNNSNTNSVEILDINEYNKYIDNLFIENNTNYIIYDSIYNNLGVHYDYLNTLSLVDINYKMFIDYMFLSFNEFNNLDEHVSYVATKLDIDNTLVHYIINNLKFDYLNELQDAIIFYDDIYNLIEGIKKGWKVPKERTF